MESQNVLDVDLCPWQVEALQTHIRHFALFGGVATGKSFTGSMFAIQNMIAHPELTGFIGANTYDQLSQATLAELFTWLDKFEIPFVIDKKPPWKCRFFKDYNNILSCLIGSNVAHIFTRVLQEGNPLRGLQFSWYWCDETRDTPENTHDIILSRCRESKDWIRGLVTTTTAGENWVWRRFVKNADGKLYGHTKARTEESMRYGIVTKDYYDTMRAAYSVRMAAQELDCDFVEVAEGRCYYSAEGSNHRWGYVPDQALPLVVCMDFNYSPAPCVWEIGQLMDFEGREGVHWFDELAFTEVSTREMANRLAHRWGTFNLVICGDASGVRGTTSNAGESDFAQIEDELTEQGVSFEINVDNSNPRIKDRIENVNRLLRNAKGEISMTYDPDACPLLADDMKKVVWKNGKPSGSVTQTHGSDAIGYGCMKLLPNPVLSKLGDVEFLDIL